MSASGSGPAPRIYRITPWPIRIGAPLVALVVILGLIHDGAAAAVPIPIVLAAAWLYAAERCGVVVTADGIESRMTRRENMFRRPWTDIQTFELADNGSQAAIVMRLRDGSRQILPSTRAWRYDKGKVQHILAELLREQAAANARTA